MAGDTRNAERGTRNFASWLDDFFASYARHRPVSATFIGVHDHDDRLPDYSPQGIAAVQGEMEGLLGRLYALRMEGHRPASPAEQMDVTLAENALDLQRWEYESPHFVTGNPSVYTGEAIFGVLSLFLRPFAPLGLRVENAIRRMEAIPALLAQGRANVENPPPAWTERAIRECDGALAFLNDGIDILIADEGITTPGFRAAADAARGAFAQHREALRRAPTDAPEVYACNTWVFDQYVRLGHMLDMDGTQVEAYAREQFAAARAALDNGAGAFGETDYRDVLAQLADSHPITEKYYGRFAQVWDAARATAEAHALVTWPDSPLRYVPQPSWARTCAPFLYFLPYRAPAPYDALPSHDYLVPPVEPTMPPDEQERRLRAVNDSVIKLNHVVHHGGIGHHVQNWHAFRAESRIGRMAGVDCASRIALFCGGTMAEGWSSYVVDLMDEVGFLTPLESYSQRYARMRAAARAIVDVNLHYGRFSLDEATAFYRDETGFAPDAARAEAVKNSMFPGAAMIYLIGQDAVRDLRGEMHTQWGAGFSLRRFHDTFLSYGSIPVPLIARAMRAGTPQ